MKLFLRRCLVLAVSVCLLPAAHAQHKEADASDAEKPWPKVGFFEVLDGRKFIPTLGHTHVEDGDIFIYLTNAGDGSNRIFVVERLGRIWIMQDDKLLPEPFLDISKLTDMRGEHGLLCLTFPPGPGKKDHFYITYTNLNGDESLARYKIDPAKPDRALPDSGEILLTIPHPFQTNHYGSQIAFGKDGYLYWSMGDGGGQYDPNRKAQSLQSFLGKMMRLDVEGKPDEGKKYRIPPDNPFIKTKGALPEIWMLGLRNPWRFSFDPANGDLYLAVVGEFAWDYIYYTAGGDKGGENYGWSIYEGSHSMHPDEKSGTDYPITFPIVEFSHTSAPRFQSVIGGYVYRGTEIPAWQGTYFFSDWITCQVWAMRRDADGKWLVHQVDGNESPLEQTDSMGVDEKGNIYALSFADGKIYKLIEKKN